MMRKLIYYILWFLLMVVVFFSCKTPQKATKTELDEQAQSSTNKLKNYGLAKLLDSITSKYLFYQNVSIKFKVFAKLFNENHELEGILRIKKDSIILISLLAPLGIEAAKVVLFTDSLIFINKLKREYFVKPYQFFEQQFRIELTFNDLQSIFMNQMFLYSETDEESNLAMNTYNNERDYIRKTFFKDKDSVNYILKTHRKHKIKRYLKKTYKEEKSFIVENIKIMPNLFKIKSIEVIDYGEKRSLLVEYSDFEKIDNTIFPKTLNFTVKDTTQQFFLRLNYEKITLDKFLNFNINIPSSYKKID